MADYGQQLMFGTFPTPDASDPQRPIELAQAAEAAGVDLVVVQDHPYQRRFFDVWALLATILARTTRLRVAPGVANLPLRPPFVLAKTAASLDLLSGGRVELGLGAGGFWEAIEAAGGPRRSPGEARRALAEAISVIRAVWDTSQRSIRIDGDTYRVRGAHPGPAPAHPMEIWVGGYGPRMLTVVGERADGWLPSWPYLPPERLGAASARIDEAAVAAGRDPAQIRRLYNVAVADGDSPGLRGGPADWPEQLAALTHEHGISTFVMWGDDPITVRRWGEEVAPAVRELVGR